MLMYTIATQDIRYEFGEKVIQKHFPWKKFEWSAFSIVILKDNILTMDFYNNKTLQEEVINEVGEIDFNNFVIKKLDGDKLIN